MCSEVAIFFYPLDGIGAWFRYHSRFAEAMQQEARRCLGETTALSQFGPVPGMKQGLSVEAIECAISAVHLPLGHWLNALLRASDRALPGVVPSQPLASTLARQRN